MDGDRSSESSWLSSFSGTQAPAADNITESHQPDDVGSVRRSRIPAATAKLTGYENGMSATRRFMLALRSLEYPRRDY